MNESNPVEHRTKYRLLKPGHWLLLGAIAVPTGLIMNHIEDTGRIPFVHYETEQQEDPSCLTIETLVPSMTFPEDDVQAVIEITDLVNTEDC